jgi:uncharacterized OsmC-like protein
MTDVVAIKAAFERNAKAVTLRPSIGQGTGITKVRVCDGFRCEIEDGPWTFTADLGEESGGGGAGPRPGVFGRIALGSCLAVGYVQWAAVLGVPITSLEVEIQADQDMRATYGVADVPAGYIEVRYIVSVESTAPEEDILHMLDTADAHSRYLDVFARAQDLRREVRIGPPAG